AWPPLSLTTILRRVSRLGAGPGGGGGGVVVGAVSTVRHQPPPIDPASPAASSSTHRLQVPFGFRPEKVDRAVADAGWGAGAGHASGPAESSSVGRKVPLTSGFGTPPAAASSKVTVSPAAGDVPPASLSRVRLVVGSGPASITSRSAGAAWERPFRVA